jgi:calcium/proton exchanger cax
LKFEHEQRVLAYQELKQQQLANQQALNQQLSGELPGEEEDERIASPQETIKSGIASRNSVQSLEDKTVEQYPSLNEKTTTEEDDDDNEEDELGFYYSLLWLAVIAILIGLCSNVLADTIEDAASSLGISSNFLAVIVLPIIGNAAEHASAIIFAYKGRPTLAISIAIGSSIQISLFVFPLLILLAWFMNVDIDYDMGCYEALTLFVATILSMSALSSGNTTWLNGFVLIMAYLVIAGGFLARTTLKLTS